MQLMQQEGSSIMQLFIHGLPPSRAVEPHEEDDTTTGKTHQTEDGEQPSIANTTDDRSSYHTADARENISHEVVESDTFR